MYQIVLTGVSRRQSGARRKNSREVRKVSSIKYRSYNPSRTIVFFFETIFLSIFFFQDSQEFVFRMTMILLALYCHLVNF